MARVESRSSTPKVKDSSSGSDLRQTAINNAASKTHSASESSSNIQTIQTVGAAPTTEFSSYNPYMSRSMYSSSFLSGEGSKSIQTLMSGGGSSTENYPTSQQTSQAMTHYSQYPGYTQATYAQAAAAAAAAPQYQAQGQFAAAYAQQQYTAAQQAQGQPQSFPQASNFQQYQPGQFQGQFPAVTTIANQPTNFAAQQTYQQQMLNPRGATSTGPRGPTTSRQTKSQSQSTNQNLAMVRITGR